MKTMLALSIVLWAALAIRAATAAPTEAAEQPEDNPAIKSVRFSYCLEDWKYDNGNCYFLNNSPDSWANAESYCAHFGSSLASAHSVWEYALLQRLTKTGGHTQAWMGGYFFEGQWRWEDGSRFDHSSWGASSSVYQHRCLQVISKEGWSNHDCSVAFPFICKKSLIC